MKQCWSSTLINVVLMPIFGWKWKLSRRTFWRCFNVDKTTLKQRWWNYVDSMSMNQRCFNVIIWFKMKAEPTFIDVVLTLTKQRWKNYVDLMLINQCCFNVDIWLNGKFESRHVHERCENSIETTLSIFIVLMFTRKWCSITKRN